MKYIDNGVRALALLACLGAALSTTPASAQAFTDTFDNGISTGVWTPHVVGFTPTLIVRNFRVEIELHPDDFGFDTGSTSPTEIFGGFVDANFALEGDYDIQVEFHLPVFPMSAGWPDPGNGVRVGLIGDGLVERISFGPWGWEWDGGWFDRECYITHNTSSGVQGFLGTSDTFGKLRQVRIDNIVTGYYWNNAESRWVEIWAAPGDGINAIPKFGAWSHDPYFKNLGVQVAFDNFQINSGTPVPVWAGDLDADGVWLSNFVAVEVAMGKVDPTVGQRLQAQADAAVAAIGHGAHVGAAHILMAFVRQVESESGNGIAPEAAAALVEGANRIIAMLLG